MEIARSFAIGDIWDEEPFGINQVKEWNEEMDEIMKWCPEYQLAVLGSVSED